MKIKNPFFSGRFSLSFVFVLIIIVALFAACTQTSVIQVPPNNQKALEILKQAQETSGAPGVSAAVAVDGKIVFSEGAGYANLEHMIPATGKTVYRIASISKPISAIGLMQLLEQGKVKLDDPIQKYIPSFPVKPEGEITLLHILTHTSGIRHYNPGEFGMMQHFNTLEDAINVFKDDPLKFAPGTQYSYTTYGFNLVQGVIEAAGGENGPIGFREYMKKFVWGPAGMDATDIEMPQDIVKNRSRGFVRERNSEITKHARYTDVSVKYVGGGIISTVEDMVKVFIALDSGVLMKPETVENMYNIHFAQRENSGRGLGWSVETDSEGRLKVSHSGGATGFKSMLINYPEQKIVVATVSNGEWYSPGRLAQDIVNVYLENK
ncbi:serine hydrolase domain-containing protein [candidate division KSB1 bacterium]